jgi:hypothetical protein
MDVRNIITKFQNTWSKKQLEEFQRNNKIKTVSHNEPTIKWHLTLATH